MQLTFDSREAAIAFAERNGWKHEVAPETSKTTIAAGTYTYKDNFLSVRVSCFLHIIQNTRRILVSRCCAVCIHSIRECLCSVLSFISMSYRLMFIRRVFFFIRREKSIPSRSISTFNRRCQYVYYIYMYTYCFLSLCVVQTQKQVAVEGQSTKIFVSPGYGSSQWFMPLTYHGDAEVVQHGPPKK